MMAAGGKSLQQVRDMVASAHKDSSKSEKLQFYNHWASQYEEDVCVLDYKAPRLAAAALASVCTVNRDSKLVLDVACGTGLLAEELQHFGFTLFYGLDGSSGMLEIAKNKELYQDLKQCLLGEDPLPVDSGKYDVVIIVGALSEGQVPVIVVHELLRVTKPAMDALQSRGLWEQISLQEIEEWEKAVSEEEVTLKSDYISGVIYIYRKTASP